MKTLLRTIAATLATTLKSREDLILENLALRQQIEVLQRKGFRPRLTNRDRTFWVLLSRFWSGWKDALEIVRPETVVAWHRKGFRLYWTWKSRKMSQGRPQIDRDLRDLIRKMCEANPLWGAPKIHGELLKLGIDVSETTVSKYMVRRRKPRSQTWRAFLDNHVRNLVSADFFVVPTAVIRVLFVFIVLRHDRREVVYFKVTAHPTAVWTGRQITEAFPWDSAPRYLLHDRYAIYGYEFQRRVRSMGIREVRTARRSPWHNAYVERVIGSIRRECLDHIVVLNERHLRKVLRSYLTYYHESRTHLSLEKDCPVPRAVDPPDQGKVVGLHMVGGLHHRYVRC